MPVDEVERTRMSAVFDSFGVWWPPLVMRYCATLSAVRNATISAEGSGTCAASSPHPPSPTRQGGKTKDNTGGWMAMKVYRLEVFFYFSSSSEFFSFINHLSDHSVMHTHSRVVLLRPLYCC